MIALFRAVERIPEPACLLLVLVAVAVVGAI
jgi:hypothetical protein